MLFKQENVKILSYIMVRVTVKNDPGSNSGIDSKYNPDLVPLRMLCDHVWPRFHQHLADQTCLVNGIFHIKLALNINKNIFTNVSDRFPELANCFCDLLWCLNAAVCAFWTQYALLYFSADILLPAFPVMFWGYINQSNELLQMMFSPKPKLSISDWLNRSMISAISIHGA